MVLFLSTWVSCNDTTARRDDLDIDEPRNDLQGFGDVGKLFCRIAQGISKASLETW
jgi:hypothetical protein